MSKPRRAGRTCDNRRFWSLLIPVLLFVSACTTGSSPNHLEPTLASIQSHILDVHCAVADCHRGPALESRLNLEAGRSYGDLVNVRSVGIRSLYRVRPGLPDSSYLLRKLTGDRMVGDRMPLNKEPLPDSVVTIIRTWIERGAPPG